MNSSQTRTFPGRFDSLAAISEFVSCAAEAAEFDEHTVWKVQMAVDEACSNIIEHAYSGTEGPIECTCHIGAEGLTVILRDHGRQFDPSQVPEPDLDAGLEERTGRGLGLCFMRRLMDEVTFEFTPESGNVVTMLKRREPAP